MTLHDLLEQTTLWEAVGYYLIISAACVIVKGIFGPSIKYLGEETCRVIFGETKTGESNDRTG